MIDTLRIRSYPTICYNLTLLTVYAPFKNPSEIGVGISYVSQWTPLKFVPFKECIFMNLKLYFEQENRSLLLH